MLAVASTTAVNLRYYPSSHFDMIGDHRCCGSRVIGQELTGQQRLHSGDRNRGLRVIGQDATGQQCSCSGDHNCGSQGLGQDPTGQRHSLNVKVEVLFAQGKQQG